MVEGHPIGYATASIVTDHGKLPEPELVHGRDEILGHLSLRERGGVWLSRLTALAVAAQVTCDDRISLSEYARDAMPTNVCFGITMEQKDGGAVARDAAEDFCAGPPEAAAGKSGKQISTHGRPGPHSCGNMSLKPIIVGSSKLSVTTEPQHLPCR
jgi:hypothetical protein